MTILFRPRHGAGGQVEARGFTLDCCALEHRMLFSAAPLNLSPLESLDAEIRPDWFSLELDGEHEFDLGPNHLLHVNHVSNEPIRPASSNEILDSWTDDGSAELESNLLNEAENDLTVPGVVDDINKLAVSEIIDVDAALNSTFENASPGTPTGIVAQAVGGDATQIVRYELIDDANGRFTIDSSTGVVSVGDGSLLDRETDRWHSILIQAASDDGTTTSDQIIVTVLDVDDNRLGFTTPLSVIGSEQSMVATTVSAVDADLPGQPITYTIAGGSDASKFIINRVTGVLRFVAMPDYEAPHDADQNNVYVVEITASDKHGGTASQAIDVRVTDVKDLPVAGNDILFAKQDTPLLIAAETLIENDSLGAGDTLSFQLVDRPVFGTLIVNADGTMSYQPAPGFLGTDRFTYQVDVGRGMSNTAIVEIHVSTDSTAAVPEPALLTGPLLARMTVPTWVDDEGEEPGSMPELHHDEGHSREIQYFLRHRLSSRIEWVGQSQEMDTLARVDSLIEEPTTYRFETSSFRSTLRTVPSVSQDRYRPSTTDLLDQLDTRALNDQLDLMIDTISDQGIPDFAVAGATMTTAAMSIGYVVWATRTSYLMTCLLAAAPAWKPIDPLPILEFTEVDEPTDRADDRLDIDRLLQGPRASSDLENRPHSPRIPRR